MKKYDFDIIIISKSFSDVNVLSGNAWLCYLIKHISLSTNYKASCYYSSRPVTPLIKLPGSPLSGSLRCCVQRPGMEGRHIRHPSEPLLASPLRPFDQVALLGAASFGEQGLLPPFLSPGRLSSPGGREEAGRHTHKPTAQCRLDSQGKWL